MLMKQDPTEEEALIRYFKICTRYIFIYRFIELSFSQTNKHTHTRSTCMQSPLPKHRTGNSEHFEDIQALRSRWAYIHFMKHLKIHFPLSHLTLHKTVFIHTYLFHSSSLSISLRRRCCEHDDTLCRVYLRISH